MDQQGRNSNQRYGKKNYNPRPDSQRDSRDRTYDYERFEGGRSESNESRADMGGYGGARNDNESSSYGNTNRYAYGTPTSYETSAYRGDANFDSYAPNSGRNTYETSGHENMYGSANQSRDRYKTSSYNVDRLAGHRDNSDTSITSNYGNGSYGTSSYHPSTSRQSSSSTYERPYRGSDRAFDYGREQEEPGMWESVKNFFGMGPKNYKRSDERIQEDVNESLYRHPGVDASEIEVMVADGVVTLSGTVTERRAKRLAEDAAEECRGVTDVRNDIRVLSTTTSFDTSTTNRGTGTSTDSKTKSRSSLQ